MRFIDIDDSIGADFPYTMSWLRQYEPVVNSDDCEIVIRDTDHHFDSIRIEVHPLNGDYETAMRYSQKINDHITSHCCKCGSTHGVRTIGEYSINSTVCRDCADVLSIKGPESVLIPALKQRRKAPDIKCRLKAADGHLFFRRSADLSYADGQFLISENNEPVILSGVYTGLRDYKGERIYTGDIILAEDAEGRRFRGMIMYGDNRGKSDRDISPQWSNFCLVHGRDSFPSALCRARRIEVIGNVVSNERYTGPIPNNADYENYLIGESHSEPKFGDE